MAKFYSLIVLIILFASVADASVYQVGNRQCFQVVSIPSTHAVIYVSDEWFFQKRYYNGYYSHFSPSGSVSSSPSNYADNIGFWLPSDYPNIDDSYLYHCLPSASGGTLNFIVLRWVKDIIFSDIKNRISNSSLSPTIIDYYTVKGIYTSSEAQSAISFDLSRFPISDNVAFLYGCSAEGYSFGAVRRRYFFSYGSFYYLDLSSRVVFEDSGFGFDAKGGGVYKSGKRTRGLGGYESRY
jgi:hypothetical protein